MGGGKKHMPTYYLVLEYKKASISL